MHKNPMQWIWLPPKYNLAEIPYSPPHICQELYILEVGCTLGAQIVSYIVSFPMYHYPGVMATISSTIVELPKTDSQFLLKVKTPRVLSGC